MSKDWTAEEWRDLVVEAVKSQLADIELLSQQFPAAGARAKEKFINDLARRLREAGWRSQL
jgi:hypothetical protein